jgi:hypothetical protein
MTDKAAGNRIDILRKILVKSRSSNSFQNPNSSSSRNQNLPGDEKRADSLKYTKAIFLTDILPSNISKEVLHLHLNINIALLLSSAKHTGAPNNIATSSS